MMTSQTLKFVDFIKTQKSRYLENETLFFLEIKKSTNNTSRATLLQENSLAAQVSKKKIFPEFCLKRFPN